MAWQTIKINSMVYNKTLLNASGNLDKK